MRCFCKRHLGCKTVRFRTIFSEVAKLALTCEEITNNYFLKKSKCYVFKFRSMQKLNKNKNFGYKYNI